ncbi:MAG TPA: type I-U CRISPR-associated helicase/endonuclease Cas3 [Pirellulales bacterium]|jgi:CRISPR-associated endonuclease/helicase Cas3|nr:type I-U CRISPR-associated helicase/endonuclease Cas3 [Pirellulales bacterium]
MNLSIEQFDEFFRALYHDRQGEPIAPFPWQTRLAEQVFREGWPECIDLPTASGKTAAIDIAVFVLACQAGLETKDRTAGRRIFFTVNRRVIVDEAFDRAKTLARKLLEATGGILKEVAGALHEIGGDKTAPPFDVAQLRGGVYRDRAWARSITQPLVVCTTADQLGSRLLFRGYGVTASSAPIHAALCGCDSLVLLDEAHVTRAFCQTMHLLTRYQSQHSTAPKMRFVQMTATPAGEIPANRRFTLDHENWSDPRNQKLKERQDAPKVATLVKFDKKKPIAKEIASRAFDAISDTRKTVGVIVNRVRTAREIERLIRDEIDQRAKKDETFRADVHLVIGRMRPIDRDDLQEKLREAVGPDRPDAWNADDKPIFVVATQCLEVGADYDFDALIAECASIDALRQRFGRLNRKGRPIEVVAAIITNDESLKESDPIYGDAIKRTWEWLTEGGRNSVDFGIAAFNRLWDGVGDAGRRSMLAPAPDAAVLLPAHLDALCQTNPQPVPSPDISYYIHGPQRGNAEVRVCWRADLGEDPKKWPEIVRLLPPSSPECMTVPLAEVKRWMGERFKTLPDADIPTANAEVADDKRSEGHTSTAVRVVAWRGSKDCEVVEAPSNIRPNDTVVIPTQNFGWESFGHIPGAPTNAEWESLRDKADTASVTARAEIELHRDCVDQAERATRQSRLRVAVRLHPIFFGRAALRGQTADDLRESLRLLIDAELKDDPQERDRVQAVLPLRFERHDYPGEQDESPESKPNQLIIFSRLLEQKDKLQLTPIDEDDEDDSLSELNRIVPLADHVRHVECQLLLALDKLALCNLESTVRASAPLHDIGKADVRFQAMLAGTTPYEAMMLPKLLGKGEGFRRTWAERNAIFARALYPRGFRHEMLSVELIEHLKLEAKLPHRDLLLHLIAAHHGYARPFAPVVADDAADETRSVCVNGFTITPEQRKNWIPSHRLDSGVAERFWKLTRQYGWWGLAWLESILRVADQQASAAEQERQSQKEIHHE